MPNICNASPYDAFLIMYLQNLPRIRGYPGAVQCSAEGAVVSACTRALIPKRKEAKRNAEVTRMTLVAKFDSCSDRHD